MWSTARLLQALAEGTTLDYLFFWGHTPKREATIDASCFSQWFPRPFEVGGVRYRTTEHFMMAGKARLFRDDAALEEILRAPTPSEAKALGRAVKNFDETKWRDARIDVVVAGNLAKFGQHSDLLSHLRATGDLVLVEASPRDRIWGIGMGATNPDARAPARWRGANLLGFALMEVRARLGAQKPGAQR